MKHVFQSNASLYNKVTEEYKNLKELKTNIKESEEVIRNTQTHLKENQEDVKKVQEKISASLEDLALECNYQKLTFSSNFIDRGYKAFSKENEGKNEVLILKKNGSENPTLIKNLPKKHLVKAARYTMMEMQNNYLDCHHPIEMLGVMGSFVGSIIAGLSVGIYIGLNSRSSINGTAMNTLWTIATGCAGFSGGGFIGCYGIQAYCAIKKHFTKKKATKFLKQYKNKGLITRGEKALESIISA